MKELLEKIKECKSYTSVGKVLGYDYYNGGVKKIVLEFCHKHGIDIEKQISDYKNRKTYCLYCGKELTGDNRLNKKFCNSSCAASYNNKIRPPKTEEERKKISESLVNFYKTHELIVRTNNGNYKTKGKTISCCINDGLVLNPYKVDFKDRIICESKYTEKECIICGKKFKPFLNANGHLYKGKTCSEECSERLRKENGIEVHKRIVEEGRFKGWQSRNILSYPERFWIIVLKNNNISFIPNKPLKHENSNYFLDFYIEKNGRKIDLEIDGKQHEHDDRHESDVKRDEYVLSCGIEVYRIKWNEINSDKGKEMMKQKIDDFIKYYNK